MSHDRLNTIREQAAAAQTAQEKTVTVPLDLLLDAVAVVQVYLARATLGQTARENVEEVETRLLDAINSVQPPVEHEHDLGEAGA